MARGDTRLRLIHAASDLMSRRGYAAAGVDDLCRLAGARKGSFYHFFPTKADLALAALELQWSVIRQQVFEPVAVLAVFDAQCGYLERWLDEASAARQIVSGDNRARARQILAILEGALLLSRVARDPGVFPDVCAAVAPIAGRLPSAARPAPGTAPELL